MTREPQSAHQKGQDKQTLVWTFLPLIIHLILLDVLMLDSPISESSSDLCLCFLMQLGIFSYVYSHPHIFLKNTELEDTS